jgi:hypothetical protein
MWLTSPITTSAGFTRRYELPTTGKPLDAADAPGKADSEMFEADELAPFSN